MKNFAALTRMRIQLTLRNKMFLFFSVVMPFGFFFLYAGVFAKGVPDKVSYLMGPVVSLTVMGSFWGLSAALVMFREQGILRRFHVTPVTPSDMLASSVVANYVLTLPTVLMEILFARVFFHVHNFGNVVAIFILVTVGTVSFASLGLVVASVTNTMQETQVLNQLLWLPLIFLSGATLPLVALPVMVQHVGMFLPATYLVTSLQRAIYFATPIGHLLLDVGALAFWAVTTFFVSAQLFRWEPESKIPRRAKLWAAATAIPFLILGIYENRTGRLMAEAQAAYHATETSDHTREAPTKPNSEKQGPAEQ
ncbi:MAG: ABC transporter permease [Acidobacteriota bacterium]|nr:ABC transporter permease [Acidobacteriota bacterium]